MKKKKTGFNTWKKRHDGLKAEVVTEVQRRNDEIHGLVHVLAMANSPTGHWTKRHEPPVVLAATRADAPGQLPRR
jgi:hypothetical protein